MMTKHPDDVAGRFARRLGPHKQEYAGYLADEFWRRTRAALLAEGLTLAEAEAGTRRVVAGVVSTLASVERAALRERALGLRG